MIYEKNTFYLHPMIPNATVYTGYRNRNEAANTYSCKIADTTTVAIEEIFGS